MDKKKQAFEEVGEAGGLCDDPITSECPDGEVSDSFGNVAFVHAEVMDFSLKRVSDVVSSSAAKGPAAPAAMPEVESVCSHPLFRECYARIEESEKNREFCRHQMPHLLDVARIAYILVLERGLPFRKEVVYAAALLHDIGKAAQYEDGEPHEVAGARIARKILLDVEGFDAREKTMIVAAVAQHRYWSDDSTPLGRLLYEADKTSRICFVCDAQDECDWPDGRRGVGVSV